MFVFVSNPPIPVSLLNRKKGPLYFHPIPDCNVSKENGFRAFVLRFNKPLIFSTRVDRSAHPQSTSTWSVKRYCQFKQAWANYRAVGRLNYQRPARAKDYTVYLLDKNDDSNNSFPEYLFWRLTDSMNLRENIVFTRSSTITDSR